MAIRPAAVRALLSRLQRLPGVGPRSARLLVEHLLTVADERGDRAGRGPRRPAHRRSGSAPAAALLTEADPCPVCTDPGRDRGLILVVEEPTAAWSVEATGEYRGLYHALLGHLSPLRGVGPDDLTIAASARAGRGRRRCAR